MKGDTVKFCPICDAKVVIPKGEKAAFYVYSEKCLGAITYVVDYAFCSKKHIMRWLRRQKRK